MQKSEKQEGGFVLFWKQVFSARNKKEKREKRDKATMETEKWEDLSERDEVTGSLEPVGASRGQSHHALKHT